MRPTVQGNNIVVTVGAGARRWQGQSLARTQLPALRRPLVDLFEPSAPSGSRSVTTSISDAARTDRVVSGRADGFPSSRRSRQEGGRIVVDFRQDLAPESLMQRLDVTDFRDAGQHGRRATRCGRHSFGDRASATMSSSHISPTTSTRSRVKPVVKLPPELQDQREYTGERLTLNFQDIETRAVLQLLADTSGQNMVISDTVAGTSRCACRTFLGTKRWTS